MKIKANFPPRRNGEYPPLKIGSKSYSLDQDGVADVDEKDAEAAFSTGNFTLEDGTLPAPEADETIDENLENESAEMLISNGEETIDLMQMDKDELRALAGDMGVEIKGNLGASRIRDAIMAHVSGHTDK